MVGQVNQNGTLQAITLAIGTSKPKVAVSASYVAIDGKAF